MKESFYEFKKLFLDSGNEFKSQIDLYRNILLAGIFLSLSEALLTYYFGSGESFVQILSTIFFAIAPMFLVAKILQIQKQKISPQFKGNYIYILIPFLLYSLYYSLLFFVGTLLFIIPGIFVLIYFSMAPIMASIDDEFNKNYFKESFLLTKKRVGPVAIASILTLILEILGYSSSLMETIPELKLFYSILLGILDSYLTIVLTLTTVKIYFHLKSIPLTSR